MVQPVNVPVRPRRETKWIHRQCAASSAIERRAGRDPNALATMALTAEAEVVAARAVRAVIVAAVVQEVVVEVSGGVVVVANGNGKSSISDATAPMRRRGYCEGELGRSFHRVRGAVTGFTASKVICDDQTTGERVRGNPGVASWDCEALGLAVDPGDRVRTGGVGTADGTAPVGGSVAGMTPTSVFCKNLTTGSTASASTSATSWDCEALGLVVEPGDRVQTGAVGTVDSPPGS